MKIKILDPIICQTDSPKILKEFLKYKKTYWKQGQYNKERMEYDSPLVDKNGNFLAGFLPRIIKACATRSIPIEIEGEFEKLPYKLPLEYPSIKLFEDQERLVLTGLKEQRGIIQSPTGTGKTVLCYAIIKPMMPVKALIICPSKSIMAQTAETFKTKFGMNVSSYGDNQKDLSGDVVVGLINSLNNMDPNKYCDLFEMIIVDECHHLSFDGMYEKFLSNCLTPCRLGVTATPSPEGRANGMAAEGLLGPIIGKFTFEEAVGAKRIAKPKLVLLPVPINSSLKDFRTYQEIYKVGIVYNRLRNGIITKYILEQSQQGKTAIVFVKLLEHAQILLEMMERKGIACEYVAGEINEKERQRIKGLLESKQISCVVATSAWKEGLDLPKLSIVLNAAGYMSERPVLQMAGRGLRITEGKEEGIIVDLIDSGKYLADHFVKRLLVYSELGWLT